jgi:ABC-type spermidine/putrescine transport system permease subunit I
MGEAVVGLAMAMLPFVILLFLIVLPAIDSLLFSLGRVPANNVAFSTGLHLVKSDHLTLEVYKNLFSSKFFIQDLVLTLVVTVLSVVGIVLVSYSLALYVRFSRGVFGRMVRTLYLIPMFIPVVIASYALITFWVDHGLMMALFKHLGLGYTSPIYRASGIVIGQIWQGIPFAVLLLGSGLDGLAEEQIEAARDVGAKFMTVFLKIVLPLNLVPLLIVATFTFIGIIGSFTIPYLLGPNAPQMLSVEMNAHFVNYNQPQPAVAMAIITFLIAAIAGVLYVRGTARTSGRPQ